MTIIPTASLLPTPSLSIEGDGGEEQQQHLGLRELVCGRRSKPGSALALALQAELVEVLGSTLLGSWNVFGR